MKELVKEFKDKCQHLISSKRFGPDNFEKSMSLKFYTSNLRVDTHISWYGLYAGIQVFLDESAPKLQKVFDSSCGFWNVQSVLMRHVEDMVENVTKIRSDARVLCRMDSVNVTESCMCLYMYLTEFILS